LGIDSEVEEWMKKIHSFLIEHKDEAFSAYELLEQLSSLRGVLRTGGSVEVSKLEEEEVATDAALEKLVEMGAAEKRTIRGEYYFSYGANPLNL
jgi:hypothetical protein